MKCGKNFFKNPVGDGEQSRKHNQTSFFNVRFENYQMCMCSPVSECVCVWLAKQQHWSILMPWQQKPLQS